MKQTLYSDTTAKKNKIELLAPAGSYEALKAVIHAGADAVYAGGSCFSARAYAPNFTKEELLEAIDYAHLFGRRIYLAVNTLLKQPEIESLYDYLLPYYERGLDAVIVQDFGVMQLIRISFSDLAIHASTQMSTAGPQGAAYLKNLGAARIVPARELSLTEIRAIKDSVDVQIECFVHGALCYSYSGQCLLSSMLGGRSGNRGRCAQPCRLPYTVLDADKKALSAPACYPLSLKDLCAAGQITDLAKAGVDSFKIEGRMKSAEYAAGVTSIYRKYIDQYLETGSVQIGREDKQYLFYTGNRSGFTDGYYKRHNGADMVTMNRPGHEKGQDAFLNMVRAQFMDKAFKLPLQAQAYIKIKKPAELTVSFGCVSASVRHGLVQAAEKQPVSREMIQTQLSKTGNTPFVITDISVHMDDAVFLPKQELNQLRREALKRLTDKMLSGSQRKQKQHNSMLKHSQSKDMSANDNGRIKTAPYFAASVEEEQQLFIVLEQDFISRIYLDSSMYTNSRYAAQLQRHVKLIKALGKTAYLILPPVFRMKTAEFYKDHLAALEQTGIDGYAAKTLDELGFLIERQIGQKRCILDYGLYAFSDYTKACYAKAGWDYDTIPPELNKKELLARDNQKSELLIYGRIPLMTSAQCIYQTLGKCIKKPGLCYLKDRYAKEFPVKNNCSECLNILYNSQPLSLIQLSSELPKIRPAGYRLMFTIENPDQVQQILDCCRQSFFERRIPDMAGIIGEYTNGHYKRGAE